jgi:hypothetical protein
MSEMTSRLDGWSGVAIERGFILPAGVNVEETRIFGCAESVDGEATRFLPGWSQDFRDGGGDCVLQSALGVEARENKHFRIQSLPPAAREASLQ